MDQNRFPTKILFLFFSLLISCAGKGHETIEGVVHLDFERIEVSNSPYQIAQIVPLETRSDNLIGDHLNAKIGDRGLFVIDHNPEDAIHHFDHDGRYIGKVIEDQLVFIVQASDFLDDFPAEISRFGLKIEKEDNPLLVYVKFKNDQ